MRPGVAGVGTGLPCGDPNPVVADLSSGPLAWCVGAGTMDGGDSGGDLGKSPSPATSLEGGASFGANLWRCPLFKEGKHLRGHLGNAQAEPQSPRLFGE